MALAPYKFAKAGIILISKEKLTVKIDLEVIVNFF
jgi:hypothetical protein